MSGYLGGEAVCYRLGYERAKAMADMATAGLHAAERERDEARRGVGADGKVHSPQLRVEQLREAQAQIATLTRERDEARGQVAEIAGRASSYHGEAASLRAELEREREARARIEECRKLSLDAEQCGDCLACTNVRLDAMQARAHAAESALSLARAEAKALREAVEKARKWILQRAESQEDDAQPFRVVFDHACGACVPGESLVVAGFLCAVHEARAALAAQPPPEEGKPERRWKRCDAVCTVYPGGPTAECGALLPCHLHGGDTAANDPTPSEEGGVAPCCGESRCPHGFVHREDCTKCPSPAPTPSEPAKVEASPACACGHPQAAHDDEVGCCWTAPPTGACQCSAFRPAPAKVEAKALGANPGAAPNPLPCAEHGEGK